MNLECISNKKSKMRFILFLIFIIVNFILMLFHEPWRDEIHAWIMAKYLSIQDLFIVSRFDGHPVLWHLILMPFAKLNFPVITLNIISWIIVSISGFFFIYKTKLNNVFKFIVLFSVPFIYIYSSISRNYCLILLFLMIISAFYNKRYSHPIVYSILICMLVFTHSLAWGLVAGLTITFHMYEIYLYYFKKKNINIKPIIIGFMLIALSSILIVLQLSYSGNSDYSVNPASSEVLSVTVYIVILLFSTFLMTLLSKKNIKEYIILFLGLTFHLIVYYTFYSSVLFERFMLLFVFYLFYIILISENKNIEKKILNTYFILYILFAIIFNVISKLTMYIQLDLENPYSSAQEMACYINNNLQDQNTVLIDSSIICQTIIPYLDNVQLYDIVYNEYFENIKYMSNDTFNITRCLENLEIYSGNYIIISHNFVPKDCELIFTTKRSLIGENYSLYYIK